MSFSCPNYDFNRRECSNLECECIPGRPGCVLENRVTLTEHSIKKIEEQTRKTGPESDR